MEEVELSEEEVQEVWEKAQIVSGKETERWRKDQCGAWMKRDQYGNRDSVYGWEKHHPSGTDDLEKRIPLQWKNNVTTGEGSLKCPVTSAGNKNVERDVE